MAQVIYAFSFDYKYIPYIAPQSSPVPSRLIPARFPIIPLRLINKNNNQVVDTDALIDSGCFCSLFSIQYATALGINLMAGQSCNFAGLGGSVRGYIHTVTISINNKDFVCEVGFADRQISRNLIGRHDFFDKVKLGFREFYYEIYLDPNP